MSKKANPFTQHIIEALMSTGYGINGARMIAYGQTEMKSLPKAKQMSKAPYYLSINLWEALYKKETTPRSS